MTTRHSLSAGAVAQLVENHRQFRSFLARRVRDEGEAEDLLQAAYVRTLERGGEVRDEESVTAWFYRLLRNALVDHYRRRGTEKRALEALAVDSAPEAPPEPDLFAAVCQCVKDLIPTLKPEQADLISTIDLSGEEHASAAARLGITPGNLRVRLHRARQALRELLVISCGSCTDHGCLDCSCGARTHPPSETP